MTPRKPIIIGASDKDSDWLKRLDGGAYQEEDLAAHDAAQEAQQEAEEQREEAQRPDHLPPPEEREEA